MVHGLSQDRLLELMQAKSDPSVSVYLTFEPKQQDNRQIVLVIKDKIRTARQALLERGMAAHQINQLLEPLSRLVDSALFKYSKPEGIAAFLSSETSDIVYLTGQTAESISISQRFWVRPLLSLFNDDHYYLLCLGLNKVRLYRCIGQERHALDLADLPESLQTIRSDYDFEHNLAHQRWFRHG